MKLICTLFFCLFLGYLQAQSITGEVRDATTGEPIPGATVQLTDSPTGIRADAGGRFSLDGKGSLRVSFVGYKSSTVKARERFFTVALVPDMTELQTVEVVGRVAKDYNSDYSFSATKITALNKDIPQSIGTVTKELMADRQAFQLADAVKIVSGVIPSSFYNQYAIRGIS